MWSFSSPDDHQILQIPQILQILRLTHYLTPFSYRLMTTQINKSTNQQINKNSPHRLMTASLTV
jgi:hypothetical protein